MTNWNTKYDCCICCSTDEWAYKANGYCIKCYPLISKRKIIEQWNPSDKSTIKPVGSIDKMTLDQVLQSGKLAQARSSLLNQIDYRLYLYKTYNSTGQINPTVIEGLLIQIASITNNISNKPLFYNIAESYNQGFNNNQRQIIARHLSYILINRKFELNIWKDIY
jgi:hypothetical protein